MDRRARVLAALEGRRVDQIPFTLWRCAYLQAETADGLARSTLDLAGRYDVDLLVLTPGPYHLAQAWGADVRSFRSDAVAPVLGSPLIDYPTAWRHLPALDVPHSSLQREIDAVRLVRARLAAQETPLVVWVPCPLATADALCGGRILSDLRAYPGDVRAALATIAAGTIRYLDACLEAGADGYLFVTPYASPGRMRQREFRTFGLAFDLQVIDALDSAPIRILHLDTEDPGLAWVSRYPVQAVGWRGEFASPFLNDETEPFRFTRVGGLDPHVFSSGFAADLEGQVAAALDATGGWRLILAPAGALPADADEDLVSAIGPLLGRVRAR